MTRPIGALEIRRLMSSTPTVSLAATDTTASESNNRGSVTFAITRSRSRDLAVHYTLGGRAHNGRDYATLSGVATIAAGTKTAVVVVKPKDDSAIEGRETIYFSTASGSYNVDDARASAQVKIQDNEDARRIAAMTDDDGGTYLSYFDLLSGKSVTFDFRQDDDAPGGQALSDVNLINPATGQGVRLSVGDNGVPTRLTATDGSYVRLKRQNGDLRMLPCDADDNPLGGWKSLGVGDGLATQSVSVQYQYIKLPPQWQVDINNLADSGGVLGDAGKGVQGIIANGLDGVNTMLNRVVKIAASSFGGGVVAAEAAASVIVDITQDVITAVTGLKVPTVETVIDLSDTLGAGVASGITSNIGEFTSVFSKIHLRDSPIANFFIEPVQPIAPDDGDGTSDPGTGSGITGTGTDTGGGSDGGDNGGGDSDAKRDGYLSFTAFLPRGDLDDDAWSQLTSSYAGMEDPSGVVSITPTSSGLTYVVTRAPTLDFDADAAGHASAFGSPWIFTSGPSYSPN